MNRPRSVWGLFDPNPADGSLLIRMATPRESPRTSQLRAVTLGVRPVTSTVVADGTIVSPENWTHHLTLGVTENMRFIEGLRFTVVLTELTVVPDDNTLTIGSLHNCRRLHDLGVMCDRCVSSDHLMTLLNRMIHILHLSGDMSRGARMGGCVRQRPLG